MVKRESKQDKENRNRISRAYSATCNGVQVNIMDIGKIFKVGQQSIDDGDDDDVLEAKIQTYVETIRQN